MTIFNQQRLCKRNISLMLHDGEIFTSADERQVATALELAHKYALENNINYTLLDGVKLGDANGDGSVNINDVTTIQRHLAELETLEGIYLHAADANQDGTVDIVDATAIQMYLAEYEMDYPIGEVMTQ